MKVKENIRNHISQLNYWALLLFTFWLPLKDNYLPAIMAVWIISWVLEANFKERFRVFPEKKYFIGFLVYFLITGLNVFRSSDISYGIFQIQEKLSLIFFPVILIGSNDKIKNNLTTILKVFIIANLAASFYCLGNAFINSLITENGNYRLQIYLNEFYANKSFWELINFRYTYFSYTYLSVFMHPSYFSMFISFSVIIIIYFFRIKLIRKTGWKIAIIIAVLFFILMLYLLQSRAALITFGIMLVFVPFIELKNRLKKRFAFISLALLIVSISFISTNKRIKSNLVEAWNVAENKEKPALAESDLRIQLWYTSVQLIKDNFWFGTGPANLTDKLIMKYEALGFTRAAEDELNAHNQYLESFSGLGIFGFLSLMFILVYSFIIAIKKHNYLLFFLILILSINFLFESILNRMSGVLFMMFFVSILVYANKAASGENENIS